VFVLFWHIAATLPRQGFLRETGAKHGGLQPNRKIFRRTIDVKPPYDYIIGNIFID